MFKYGSRCFDSVRDASLYYRIPEKDVIKYLMNNNDMEQLIEDLGLDDLIEVNTLYQRSISDTISEIQDIYREYMMLENADEITLLDAIEEDLRLAADSIFFDELNFEDGDGHWGFYSHGYEDPIETIEEDEDPTWVITPEPAYLFSDPYPLQIEMVMAEKLKGTSPERIAEEILAVGDRIQIPAPVKDSKDPTDPGPLKEAGTWLGFNK
jgi:hypothetical protein